MPIPGGLSTITVTSAYPAIDGAPLTGSVLFETLQPIMDAAGKVKFSGSATRAINRGTMTPIVLPCTDNSSLNPTGFSYKITETINGVTQTPFWVSLPSSLGATVDLSALTPASTPPSVSAFASNNVWTGSNTFQGETIVPTPVNATDAATKAYVDAHGTAGAVTVTASGDTSGATDTAAIQAAINAQATAGGGSVVLAKGTFYITSIFLRTNVTVQGVSLQGTVLQAIASHDTNPVVSLYTGSEYSWQFRNLTINGGNGPQNGTHGLQSNLFDNININAAVNTGQFFGPQGTDMFGLITDVVIAQAPRSNFICSGRCSEIRLSNVYAIDSGKVCYEIDGQDVFLENCTAGNSGQQGFRVNTKSSQLVNCKAWWSGYTDHANGDGFLIAPGTGPGTLITGCFAQDNFHNGFTVYGQGVVLSGCSAAGNTNAHLGLYGATSCTADITLSTSSNNAAHATYALDWTGTPTGNAVTIKGNATQTANYPVSASFTGNVVAFGGSPTLDTTAADIQPLGVRSAGATGLAADASHVHQNNSDLSLLLAPSGATAETFPRQFGTVYLSGLTSGTVYVSAVALPAGLTVSNLTAIVGNAAFTGVTHGWYAFLDANRVVRAVSTDQSSGNWTSTFTVVSLPMGTPYVTPSAGVYYVAFCGSFTGSGSLVALGSALGGVTGVAPALQGSSSTGQSTPPAVGTTLAAITTTAADRFYAYTS